MIYKPDALEFIGSILMSRLDSSLGKSKEKIPMLLSRKEELAEIRH